MKSTLQSKAASLGILCIVAFTALSSSCKKPKVIDPPLEEPPEVITTFKLTLTDSATGTSKSYVFTDPDGEGGQPAFFGPDKASQTDSVIRLKAKSVYSGEVVLLDETKNPAIDISAEVRNESSEHMLFYGQGNSVVVNGGNPFTVKLVPSNVTIAYTDLDNGSPQRGLGLTTRWRTADSTQSRSLLSITLRHQPGAKDGSFAPGNTDVEVAFRLKID